MSGGEKLSLQEKKKILLALTTSRKTLAWGLSDFKQRKKKGGWQEGRRAKKRKLSV